jgi:hypothetical protein
MSPFEHRTAVIFQALIPTLNAFQTFVRKNCKYGWGIPCFEQCNVQYLINELMLAFCIQHMLIKKIAFVCSS